MEIQLLAVTHFQQLSCRCFQLLISKLPFLNVAEASDEKEAFLEIETNRPDLVIMDIHLAAENGLNLTKLIKMRYPCIPIAINTHSDSPEYKTAAEKVGAEYFLSKKSNTINDLALLAGSIFLRKSGEVVMLKDTNIPSDLQKPFTDCQTWEDMSNSELKEWYEWMDGSL